MEQINSLSQRYLEELRNRTQGDTTKQVPMFEVGEALGLEKAEAGTLAEDLIIMGCVELKTLSGAIGITNQGLEMAGGAMNAKSSPAQHLRLSAGPVVLREDCAAINSQLTEIRAWVVCGNVSLGQIEEIVVDLKTIEVQMLSPRPKTAILRETLRSLQAGLRGLGAGNLADNLNGMIS